MLSCVFVCMYLYVNKGVYVCLCVYEYIFIYVFSLQVTHKVQLTISTWN